MLKNLYSGIGNNEQLIGEVYSCDLLLKFASERWLLFYDGYVRLNPSTRYSFLTFVKGMKLPEKIEMYKVVNVTFRVIAKNGRMTSGGLPGLEVQLIQLKGLGALGTH